MQIFEEIPFFEDPATVNSSVITEKGADGKDVIVAGTIETLVSRLADQGIPGISASIDSLRFPRSCFHQGIFVFFPTYNWSHQITDNAHGQVTRI